MLATSLTVRYSLWQHNGRTILRSRRDIWPSCPYPSGSAPRSLTLPGPVRDLQVADKAVKATQASRNPCVLLRSFAQSKVELPSAGFAGKIGARSAGLEPATFSVRSWTGWMSADLACIRETLYLSPKPRFAAGGKPAKCREI
jgi:hypothetical protein